VKKIVSERDVGKFGKIKLGYWGMLSKNQGNIWWHTMLKLV
jgi:hypothetical protein